MIDAGIDNVLVGYPIVGPPKFDRLISLAERATITVSLDAIDVAARSRLLPPSAAADRPARRARHRPAPGRAWPPGPDAVALAEQIAELPGVELIGVLTHEGHAYARPHRLRICERLTRDACERTVETAEAIRARGHPGRWSSVGLVRDVSLRDPGRRRRPRFVRARTSSTTSPRLPSGAATCGESRRRRRRHRGERPARPRSRRRRGQQGADVRSDDRQRRPVHVRCRLHRPGTPATSSGSARSTASSSFPDADESPRIGDRVAIVPNHVCPIVNLFDQRDGRRGRHGRRPLAVAARGKLQ